jgi:CDP-2,3-bis-(O-geranylgeranyl)-sn-glycerol synthase
MADPIAIIGAALTGFWLFFPAYLANPSAVLSGHGRPVDLGKEMGGRRILGDGKTWYGLIGGTLAGGFIGVIQMLMAGPTGLPTFGTTKAAILIPFVLAFGSLFGDMLGSFIKRRINIERGAKAPILDQYDFVIGAFIIGMMVIPCFMIDTYLSGIAIAGLVALIVVTPPLHRAVNIIGYKTGQKDVPW